MMRQSHDAILETLRKNHDAILETIRKNKAVKSADILETIRLRLDTASGVERNRLLVSALSMWAGLPYWLNTALREALIATLPQPGIHWTRWNLLCALRDESGLTWNAAKKRASEMLKDTPAKGTPAAIYESYKRINREHSHLRRPRTNRRGLPGWRVRQSMID
jgi:hypothetical protein